MRRLNYDCQEAVTKPATGTRVCSELFGVPKGNVGRRGADESAIILHCIADADAYISQCHADFKTSASDPLAPASVHFIVTVLGEIIPSVCLADIAWGFGVYRSNFPVTTTPNGCDYMLGVFADNPLVLPDALSIHIAVETPHCTLRNTGVGFCVGAPYNKIQYERLVHLIAYLTAQYEIPRTTHYVQFADNITVCPDEQFTRRCSCTDIYCVLCDVNKYCEPCAKYGDGTHGQGQLDTIYGSNIHDCRIEELVSDMLIRTLAVKQGVVGIVASDNTFTPLRVILPTP